MDGFSFQAAPEGHVRVGTVVGFGLGSRFRQLAPQPLSVAWFVSGLILAQPIAQAMQDHLRQFHLFHSGQSVDVFENLGFVHGAMHGNLH